VVRLGPHQEDVLAELFPVPLCAISLVTVVLTTDRTLYLVILVDLCLILGLFLLGLAAI
jgi:hypothetical protein